MTVEPKPIPTDLAMLLRPAQNGGWIIESVRESHMMPSVLGAFTNPADMLAALQEAFYPKPEFDAETIAMIEGRG
jgi:hypothetical protein